MAPRSPNIQAFERNLAAAESWLAPFNGYGPDNFLVGWPEFSFDDYRGWLAERFPPNRFKQLLEKMDLPTLYAIGAFIQSLEQNPGIEQELTRLGTAAHVYMGTGLGSIDTIATQAVRLAKAQRRWDRFWAERNPELAGVQDPGPGRARRRLAGCAAAAGVGRGPGGPARRRGCLVALLGQPLP